MWWFLDTLVVEHRFAPDMNTVVLEMTLSVGAAPPLHVHDNLDDTWYILEGQMVVRCGDEELVVGEREARILLVHDNPSFRDFIRELGIPADTQIVPSQPLFPPLEELARV